MRIQSDRGVGRLAWALVALVVAGWLVNWWVPSADPAATCTGWPPDCGIVIRDR